MRHAAERAAPGDAYGRLVEIIRSGQYAAGDKLPNEREIARRFLVGRGVVRSALLRMQAEGIVERKVGSGTFLSADASSLFEMRDAGVSLTRGFSHSFYDMVEARLHFEPEVASTAAAMDDAAGVAALERRLRKVGAEGDWLAFKEAIYAFHRGIYVIASNRFLLSVFDSIHRARRAANYDGRNLNAKVARIIRNQATEDLRPICSAIADGDGAGAADRTRGYLLRILAGR